MGGGPAGVVLHVLVFVIALFLYNVVLTTPAQLHADGPRCLALSSLADDEWTGLFKFWISNVLWRFEYYGYCTNERSTLNNNGRIVRLIRSGSKLCIKRFFGMMLCQVYSTIVIGSVVWIFETCIITRSTSYDLVVKIHIIYIWPMMVGVCTLYQKRLQNLMDQISSSITDFFSNVKRLYQVG